MNFFKLVFFAGCFILTSCGGAGSDSTPTENNIPVVSNLTIYDENGGGVYIGDLLTASYSYSDIENDQEGLPIYRWYRDEEIITDAVSKTYQITAEDAGHSLSFEITPKAISGNLTGEAKRSPLIPVVLFLTPENFTLTQQSLSNELTWDLVAGADAYRIYFNTTGNVSLNDTSVEITGSSYSHANLSIGTTYYYAIAAVNNNGLLSDLSMQLSRLIQQPLPAAAENVQISVVDGEITLSWDAAEYAETYTVYWNTAGGVSTTDNSIDAATNTQITQSNLDTDKTYSFIVVSNNTTGSTSSTEVAAFVEDRNWHWAMPTSTGAILRDVIYTGSQFIAGGGAGIITSTDGVNWRVQSNANTHSLASSGSLPGSLIVATGSSGIYTSTDGLSWSFVYQKDTRTVTSVSWTGSMFIAAGTGGLVYTSANGTDWTEKSITGSSTTLVSTASNGSLHIVVAQNGIYYTSTDGINWTSNNQLKTSFSSSNLYSVIWDGNQFVITGAGGSVYFSDNADTWSVQNVGKTVGGGSQLYDIAWTGNKYVIAATFGYTYESSDGVTWLEFIDPDAATNFGVTWSGSQLVLVGDAGSIMTSPETINWSQQRTGTLNNLNGVIWTGTQYVAVGDAGTIVSSANGVDWSEQNSGTTNILYDVTWTGNRLYAVGEGGITISSTDGVSWANHSSAGDWLYAITWNGTALYACGFGNRIVTKSDSTSNWVTVNASTGSFLDKLSDITSSGNTLVAAGSRTLVSEDGINWVTRDAQQLNKDMKGVTWGGDQFIAVNLDGLIKTSPAGQAWTSMPRITSSSLNDVIVVSSEIVAVGSLSVLSSFDSGLSWRKKSVTPTLNSVASNGNQLVAVGNNGNILYRKIY